MDRIVGLVEIAAAHSAQVLDLVLASMGVTVEGAGGSSKQATQDAASSGSGIGVRTACAGGSNPRLGGLAGCGGRPGLRGAEGGR